MGVGRDLLVTALAGGPQLLTGIRKILRPTHLSHHHKLSRRRKRPGTDTTNSNRNLPLELLITANGKGCPPKGGRYRRKHLSWAVKRVERFLAGRQSGGTLRTSGQEPPDSKKSLQALRAGFGVAQLGGGN
jgi:hypothetical protein